MRAVGQTYGALRDASPSFLVIVTPSTLSPLFPIAVSVSYSARTLDLALLPLSWDPNAPANTVIHVALYCIMLSRTSTVILGTRLCIVNMNIFEGKGNKRTPHATSALSQEIKEILLCSTAAAGASIGASSSALLRSAPYASSTPLLCEVCHRLFATGGILVGRRARRSSPEVIEAREA